MDREKARAALDAAFASSIDKLFTVLAANLMDGAGHPPPDVEAQRKFAAGLAIHGRAYALASAEIDRLFTE